ncbi:proclotting enzyme-like [Pollicipes pollicipes]|uniref:proclotting enzyme-like n=1 Tax=Pollicipes pollicipes TaxID=41117 RepID=UPI001884B4AA|nr:proclotting enzyme-like [Pollicipes pollicipes]
MTAPSGDASNVLQEVSLPVVGINECQSKYESASSFQRQFPGGFGDTKLCAAEKDGGKDACQGDSGGPMVLTGADGKYQLIGVVSAGVGCGTPGFPGVYTRVSAYLDWIQQNKF